MVIERRRLSEVGTTRQELGGALGLSKERVRQIETRALEKLKRAMERNGPGMLPTAEAQAAGYRSVADFTLSPAGTKCRCLGAGRQEMTTEGVSQNRDNAGATMRPTTNAKTLAE